MTARQKQNLTEWIAALRSGKYKQGRNALCKDGKYCCLGVACEIKNQLIDSSIDDYKITKKAEQYMMPDQLWFKRTFGFDTYDTLFKVKGDFGETLPILNDIYNLSFKKIANLLEKTFLKD
jgi:hypothetical protein